MYFALEEYKKREEGSIGTCLFFMGFGLLWDLVWRLIIRNPGGREKDITKQKV